MHFEVLNSFINSVPLRTNGACQTPVQMFVSCSARLVLLAVFFTNILFRVLSFRFSGPCCFWFIFPPFQFWPIFLKLAIVVAVLVATPTPTYELTSTHVAWDLWYLEDKKRVDKISMLRRGVPHLQSCLLKLTCADKVYSDFPVLCGSPYMRTDRQSDANNG